jgi:ubiquinone biosynthesis protein COQ4
MHHLARNKDNTEQVFELIRAMAGRSMELGYRRLLASPEGGRIAYLREELAERLSDEVWLAQFEPGSVGAAYRDLIHSRQVSARKLAAENRKVRDSDIDAAHPYAWYERRLRDLHDVWHTLTGYGLDTLGELCVVAFSYGQTRSLGFAAIAMVGVYKFSASRNGHPYTRAILKAWRDGRRAEWLPALDCLELFSLPLEEARNRLQIPTPQLYNMIPPQKREKLSAEDLTRKPKVHA